MMIDLLRTDEDWVLTIVRLVLGAVMAAHGAQKLLGWFGGHGLDATVRGFREHLGIPAPLAYLAIAAEFFGGLGLVVGFLSRIAALGIAVTMAVALFKVHWPYGLFLNWSGDRRGHGIEFHLLAIALALVVIVHGAGSWSFDLALYRYLASPGTAALDLSLILPFLLYRFRR
jgi:putative oxidoreductase